MAKAARTSKSSKSKSKPKSKSSKKTRRASGAAESVRMTVSVSVLVDLAKLDDQCKDRAATANGQLGSAIRGYVDEKGLNAPAWNLVNRIRRAANRDALKARILWEDILDYYDKLGIEKLLARNMFAEPEGHAARERKVRSKKNGGAKQRDLVETAQSTEPAATEPEQPDVVH